MWKLFRPAQDLYRIDLRVVLKRSLKVQKTGTSGRDIERRWRQQHDDNDDDDDDESFGQRAREYLSYVISRL